ncbi:MAG: hypothetical protein DDT22_00845 [candidate division WS2 bacterium]|nr:hypothetical protein [Bacillota bacterium]MBT9175171.1 hypothetical protein [Candidatus Lithacetigena glycinireducens]
MKRKEAYALMEHIFEIPKHEAHIAKLNIEQCKKLINALLVRQGEIKSPEMKRLWEDGNSVT